MLDIKMPIRANNSHKGTFGRVLHFCGSKNYIGAAYLSALSALKIGAGLCALSSEKEVIASVSSKLSEAIYYTRQEGLSHINDFDIVLIGCGLGTGRDSKNLLRSVFKDINEDKSLVIDADGLNLLARINAKNIFCCENTIITPHPKEASRLLGCDVGEILENMEESAKNLTQKYQCTTVLKSHRTIVCSKNQEIYINQHGNSALAKSGTGDVIAGIISGLLAQKMKPYEACKLGVYLHSRAGEIASKELSEYSVLASDVIDNLPKAIKEIL